MILDGIPLRIHCRKRRCGQFMLQYFCPKTGTRRNVPIRKSGLFSTKKDALAWASEHLPQMVKAHLKHIEHQSWRRNTALLTHYGIYAAWRKEEHPRSAAQELSVLSNYVFPFFVSVLKQSDPNKWHEFGEEFSDWLLKRAKTKAGKPLVISTGNRAISAANQFLKWMDRKKRFQTRFKDDELPFEYFDPRKMPKRSFRDLVPEDVFNSVHEYLKGKNLLYADLWCVQRRMGFRVNELLGLAFHRVSETCPHKIRKGFESEGLKVFGSVYLESQPKKQNLTREADGSIARVPLKGREAIGPEFSRTIPVLDKETWDILVRRYEEQCDLWEQPKRKYGDLQDSYLLFDGARPTAYRDLIREAYASLNLESAGTHVLRHTLSTEWAELEIKEKLSEIVLGHKARTHKLYVHIVGQVCAERLKAAPMPRLRKV